MTDDPILARKRAEAKKTRQRLAAEKAEQQSRSRVVAANNRVEDLGGEYESKPTADKEYLTRWVNALAEYKAALAERESELLAKPGDPDVLDVRGWQDRLTEPPKGSAGSDPDASQKAVEIFLASGDTRRAVKMLKDLATDPDLGGFAVSVAGCLRREIRHVAEGWRDKTALVVTIANAEQPPIYWLDDRTYRVGNSQTVPVHGNYDCLLRAFLNRPVLDLPALVERSGLDRDHIITILGRLTRIHDGLFAPAILRPGRGGKGQGYRATVIDARRDHKV
jgi:hypothetical protein